MSGSDHPRDARTRRTIIIAAAAVALVGAITGIALYRDRVMPYRTVVLEVDGSPIRMRYFLKRVALSGAQPVTVLQSLAQEQVLKEVAGQPPYGITVAPQEIEQLARSMARGTRETLTEGEYREWRRQQLNESRLSEAEYQGILEATLVRMKMAEYLGTRVPTVAEQVFLNMIQVKDAESGAEVKRRADAGADFGALARAYSTDAALKAGGGKAGWFPRGILKGGLDGIVFSLRIGQASEPLYMDEKTIIVLMVSERAAAREIDGRHLEVLRSRALDDWIPAELRKHSIRFRGFHDGYDSETDSWVRQQVLRMKGGA
jgi:parvulin-like peptidyl-prolyl isomerase